MLNREHKPQEPLNDRWAIAEIVSLHGHIFDAGQLDRLEEIFTPEIVYDMSAVGIGVFAGIDVVRNAAARMGDQGPIAHHVTNVVISSEANDLVTARSKGLMVFADGRLESVNHLDTLHRHHGDWRISRRIISPVRTARVS
jgi:hypothetical protein